MIRTCKHHGQQEHILNGKTEAGTQKYKCTLCSRKAVNKHRADYKQKMVDHAGGKCQLCGYNKYIGALQFHHKDPKEKDFILSRRHMGLGWDRIVKEVNKCMLLCANCHAEVHAKIKAV
jgi:5-methylcytosine-specific restriction endonuclease McrA